MATSTFNKLKKAFDQLGITLEPNDDPSIHSFKFEHFDYYLYVDEERHTYAFIFNVIDANGNLTEEDFNDTIDIVNEDYALVSGDWNEGTPLFFSAEYLLCTSWVIKPETLMEHINRFHEAVLFLQINLFLMTDGHYSDIIG